MELVLKEVTGYMEIGWKGTETRKQNLIERHRSAVRESGRGRVILSHDWQDDAGSKRLETKET